MDLYKYYLQQGVWDILDLLYKEIGDPLVEESIEKLIWEYCFGSLNLRSPTQLVGSPWQQRWLAANVLSSSKLLAGTDVNVLKREIEFQQVLDSLVCSDTPQSVVQELRELHGKVQLADRERQPVDILSPGSRDFLLRGLLRSPAAAHAATSQLLCLWSPHFADTDAQIQDLCEEALWACLRQIEEQGRQGEDHGRAASETQPVDTLLCLLSVLQAGEARLRDLGDRLCPRLRSLCGAGLVEERWLHLGLLSRGELGLLRALTVLEDEARSRDYAGTDPAVLEAVCRRIGEGHLEELFYRTVGTRRHWVEDLAVMCSALMIAGKGDVVDACLSQPGLSTLWPIVLLHTWREFGSSGGILAVLDVLIARCKGDAGDPALERLATALEDQVDVVRWCRRHGGAPGASDGSLLELAKDHSALEVLRRTADLAALDETEVRELLVTSGYSRGGVIEPSSNIPNWQVITFDGFCIMMHAFTIIQSGMEFEKIRKKLSRNCDWFSTCDDMLKLLNPVLSAILFRYYPQVHQSGTMNTEDNIKCLQQNYDEKVVKTLETMQQMICKLFPLNFRVEILENIFSLLFLRFEDLRNESSSESGSDSGEVEAAGKDDPVPSGPPWTANELGDVFRDVAGPSASLSDIPLIKASVSESRYSGSREQLAADARPSDVRPPEASDAGRGRGGRAREPLDRRRKSATLGNSSKSTSDSSCATTSQGFVCGRLVVRDLVHCLKACLLDTSASLYGSRSHEDPAEDSRDVQSSVRPEELQKRLNRLIQYVSEAAWRLELLTDSQFASSYGTYSDCKASLARESVWAYQGETSSSESDEEAAAGGGGARGGRAKRGATQDLERSSSSGGLSLAAGGGPSSNSHRKMKWSKRHYQPAPLPHSHGNIIRLMLSSQSSLAIRCLTQGDHVKARDVIQKFDVEGNSLVAEVKFTEAYQNLRNRLEACCAVKDQSSYGSCGQSSGSSLPYKKSIENVASGVVQSSSLASQLENFLSVVPLPNLHSTNLQEQDGGPSLDGASDDARAVIAVDLALTLGNSYQQSVSLLDVACRHCPELQGGDGPGRRKKKTLSGRLGFARDAIGLLKEVNAEERDPGAGVLPADVSLRDLLLSAQYPLALKPLRGVLLFWSDLDSASRDLAAALAIEDERRRTEDPEPASEVALKNVYGAKVNACFRTLLKVSQRNVLTAGGEGNASSHLPNLYLYLKLLTTLWVQHCPTVSDSHAPATYFDVLEDSVTRFVGRLVFEYGVPPAQLEPVATRLNLNLVHEVVRNCCPRVPSALPPAAATTGRAAGDWGRIALNRPGQASNGGTRHPETCVKVLLTSVIDTLRKYSSPGWTLSSQQQFASASEDPELTKLLAETGELATADTKMLTSADETLSFLINLRNLLWLHSVVGPEARHLGDGAAEGRHLQCGGTAGVLSPCPLEQLATMKCVGYDVGGLGFVSLYDLQVLLLGKELAHSASLPDCAGGENPTLGKLNVFSDPRIVFSLAYGQADSPKVQVMGSDNVDAQLNAHMAEYLDHFVCVEEINGIKQLTISLLVQRYHEHVLLNQDPESYSAVLDTPDVADTSSLHRWEKLLVLLEFLKDNTTGRTREQLCELADLRCGDVVVSVGDYPGSGVMLGYGGGGAPAPEGDDADGDAWRGQVLSDPVLQFLERRCRPLAALARRLHGREGAGEHPCLDRLLSAGDDDALLAWPPAGRLWGRLGGLAEARDWAGCVRALRALPPARLLADTKLQALLDAVLCGLAASVPSTESPCPWQYCRQIGNTGVRARCVLGNMSKWPVDVCADSLLALAEGPPGSLPPWLRSEVDGTLRRILVYRKILTGYQFPKISSWYELSYFSSCDPGLVIEHLIQSELCLEWAELHDIPSRMPQLIDYRYIALLLKRNAAEAVKLLESLPEERAVAICNKLVEELKDLPGLKTVADVLLGRRGDLLPAEAAVKLRELLVGVRMLSALPAEERERHADLAGWPHLVLEELLMNTRLEALGAALSASAGPRAELPPGSPVSPASVDDLLRRYAARALETGGGGAAARARATSGADSREDRLLASLAGDDSGGFGDAFVMPDRVPAKREWMRDDEVMQCKCCDAVFTMFNRRHHCRRCGRVVCAACSTRKMQVVGYGSVAVRACDKCYERTQLSDQLPVSSLPESVLQLELQAARSPEQLWRLSADEAHNWVVRDEFCFEHAPSVSLCLAILRLHSDDLAYARFLLNACRSLMQQLWTDVAKRASMKMCSSDLDFSLIIKMVRSLATAAKVNFSQPSSVDECCGLLDETDLLAVLVEHGCTRLLPPEGLGSPGGLRKVRDRLVEEELWLPAIDVSTRTGLDRGGVWAAWGKACLRAGRWGQARDKFARCLGGAGSRPSRDPPLLADVLEILEAGAHATDDGGGGGGGGGGGVVSSPVILHTLSSLKDVAQGRYPDESPAGNAVVIGPGMEPLRYAECQYYLDAYGSHAGILRFYVGHDDLRAALRHALASEVDPDVFYEQVYLACLRLEQLSELHYELTAVDPHLAKWKVYLKHVCLQLERQKLLNVLYQLQLFMKDYVRAAMTCIRFYLGGARSYSDLAANQESLRDAKKHLEANLDSRNTTADSSQMAMRLEPRELNRHIGTIVRQLEVTKFLRDCEREGRPVPQLTAQVCKGARVPTLFGNAAERIQLAVLVILSARNLEEGFGIAFRIIQDYHLNPERVYCLAGRELASDGRTGGIEQLIGCVSGSGLPAPAGLCDEVLASCVRVLAERPGLDADALGRLVKLMKDVGNKISAYITCRQLKSAYLLAVKHNRLSDIRRILHEAERLGQTKIKQICLKRLALHPEV
ncbi:zinc finger FYVE domain-containing protein 26 isoform X2 [Bacillus rossius redtenbacheri]|uniref:zinc finger FYVE domain-containing protein 26 isoform X2 n=1 Tax=Bacillus rossius redtenbacheri TaxID=93214 RepID=UPI002FDD7792